MRFLFSFTLNGNWLLHLDNRNACAKRSWFIKDIVLLNSYNAIIFQLKGMKALY